ncbi:biotin--[acetyl-CoA-carboxylase] ligase [Maridesulfovibrio bastinii]|uniref:biotin--[acetyl-CoA-carboxylase] ligase n=1 Tax=Maridesulfovibrio bastinii TaxID=47157 RepID=UPI000403FE15|nr:biotin--[acetyl-CoA-carboxylase] ligase [Maridesulfovibrio bastinii]
MISRITIVSGKEGSPVAKVTPETFFVSHPLWANDIENLGPWNREELDYLPYDIWLSGARKGVPVAVCGACQSSFEIAWYLNRQEDLPEWGSVLALEQTSGRGQVRREWISPSGNIYAVLKWPALKIPAEVEGRPIWTRILPLIVGDLLCKAFASLGVDISLKWPNDLLIGNKKVGGILIEERDGVAMVGIGINLDSAPDKSLLRKDSIFADKINSEELQLSPLATWVEIVPFIKGAYTEMLANQEPSLFLDKLARNMVWANELVRVVDGPEGLDHGIVSGLTEDGGLVIDCDGEKVSMYSGSILPYEK